MLPCVLGFSYNRPVRGNSGDILEPDRDGWLAAAAGNDALRLAADSRVVGGD